MDISTLNTKKGAEKGAFMQLAHPITGAPLVDDDGEPVGLYLRGSEAPTVQKKLRAMQKATMSGGEQTGMEYVCSLVVGVQGLDRDGRPLTTSRADLEFLFDQSDAFVEQVVAFARDRANFFGQTASD